MGEEVEFQLSGEQKLFNEVNVTEYEIHWNPFVRIAEKLRNNYHRDLTIISNCFTTKESAYEYNWTLVFEKKTSIDDDHSSRNDKMVSLYLADSCGSHGADNKMFINVTMQSRIKNYEYELCIQDEVFDLSQLGCIFDAYIPKSCNILIAYNLNFVIRMKIIWRDLKNLNTDFEKLYLDQYMTDVSFVFKNNKEIKAHKLILMARSPVFKAMFESNMLESKQNRVEIEDMDPQIFETLISYIYTGKIKFTPEDNLIDLIIAADKYAFTNFKDYCEKEAIKLLNIENVADNLIASNLLNLNRLKTEAIKFIISKKQEFLKSDGYKNLIKDHVHLIIEMFENS